MRKETKKAAPRCRKCCSSQNRIMRRLERKKIRKPRNKTHHRGSRVPVVAEARACATKERSRPSIPPCMDFATHLHLAGVVQQENQRRKAYKKMTLQHVTP